MKKIKIQLGIICFSLLSSSWLQSQERIDEELRSNKKIDTLNSQEKIRKNSVQIKNVKNYSKKLKPAITIRNTTKFTSVFEKYKSRTLKVAPVIAYKFDELNIDFGNLTEEELHQLNLRKEAYMKIKNSIDRMELTYKVFSEYNENFYNYASKAKQIINSLLGKYFEYRLQTIFSC